LRVVVSAFCRRDFAMRGSTSSVAGGGTFLTFCALTFVLPIVQQVLSRVLPVMFDCFARSTCHFLSLLKVKSKMRDRSYFDQNVLFSFMNELM
jgi:hypothetical protein